jgi:hypothetical protein
VPVVCSSPDYMACHSQIFPSIWGSVRSDDLPVLTQSAPEIRVLPISVQGPGPRASRGDPRRATVREMKEGPWSSAIGWISTHRNLLWSKASAVPVANRRPERPLQNVGDPCSGTETWKAVEDIACACRRPPVDRQTLRCKRERPPHNASTPRCTCSRVKTAVEIDFDASLRKGAQSCRVRIALFSGFRALNCAGVPEIAARGIWKSAGQKCGLPLPLL